MEGWLRRSRPEDPRLTKAGDQDGRGLPKHLGIEGVRARIRAEPPRPYDNLESSPFPVGGALAGRLRSLTDDGFEKFGRRINVSSPDFTVGDRTFHFLLHAWDPLATFLHGLLPPAHPEGLAPASAYATAWLDAFEAPARSQGAATIVDSARSGGNEAWEGMATGMRAFRLAALIDAVARSDGSSDALLGRLVDSLDFHFEVLGHPGFFQSWSNHGLYQSLGLLSAGARFPWLAGGGRMAELARHRLEEMLSSHFDADGVHLEHSPTYHFNLLGSLIGARNAGLLEGSTAALTISRAEQALSWMINPAGRLAAFGDSWPAPVRQDLTAAARFRDPALRFLTSDGAIGDPPESGVKLYRNAGYAFARILDRELGETPDQASYLAQAGAFHSRVHKHADNLGFIWSEGLADILVEPGRYGYLGRVAPGDPLHDKGHWYADPKRIFVESTRAHNCVEVDGESHLRKGAKPFGGAITQADQSEELVVFASAAPLDAAVSQERILILKPRSFLLVLDSLVASDEAHDFRQWFQMDGAWTATAGTSGYWATMGQKTLTVTDLTGQAVVQPVRRAQTEPELQGWVSVKDGELTPASSLCLLQSGTTVRFATLFAFGDGAVSDPALSDEAAGARVLSWSQDGKRTLIRLTRTPLGVIQAQMSRQPG
jgi:hypothetical protein